MPYQNLGQIDYNLHNQLRREFLVGKNSKMAAEVFLSCLVTVAALIVINSLAYGYRNMAKKMLEKDES